MSDHNHPSSVQGSNREQDEPFGWRKEIRFLSEQRVVLPSFYERVDIDEFLDWEMKVKQIFHSHHVEEDIKVSLVTLTF